MEKIKITLFFYYKNKDKNNKNIKKTIFLQDKNKAIIMLL